MQKPTHNSRSRSLAAILLLAMSAGTANAAEISVRVLDPEGKPVPDVAVFVEGETSDTDRSAAVVATMDQVDTRFVPHILVVKTGTAVEFPNSDIVAHHVYSFSKPNNFVLPLYKGDAHEPVTLDHNGVVTLGCNIHDEMLGFIVVVDSDSFGKTDANGRVTLRTDPPVAGRIVKIWSPRLRDDDSLLSQAADSSADSSTEVTFRMQESLRAPHHSRSDAVQWPDY